MGSIPSLDTDKKIAEYLLLKYLYFFYPCIPAHLRTPRMRRDLHVPAMDATQRTRSLPSISFSRRFVRHTRNLSTAGIALIAAEEFFLLVGATWIANQWDNISSMGLPFSGFCPPSCRAYRPMSDHRSIHTRNRVDAARGTVLHFRHNPDNRHLRHRDDSLVHFSGIVFRRHQPRPAPQMGSKIHCGSHRSPQSGSITAPHKNSKNRCPLSIIILHLSYQTFTYHVNR